MNQTDVERIAAAINKLGADVRTAKSIIQPRTIALLIAHETGYSQETIFKILNALENLPQHVLTAQGRTIRIRDEDDD